MQDPSGACQTPIVPVLGWLQARVGAKQWKSKMKINWKNQLK